MFFIKNFPFCKTLLLVNNNVNKSLYIVLAYFKKACFKPRVLNIVVL